MRRIAGILLVGIVAVACTSPDREIRLARLDAERRNLETTFDQLEDRLLVNQARVRFWQEMRERHESASAIACASLDQHATEMAMRGILRSTSTLDRKRVAVASPGASERVSVYAGRGGE